MVNHFKENFERSDRFVRPLYEDRMSEEDIRSILWKNPFIKGDSIINFYFQSSSGPDKKKLDPIIGRLTGIYIRTGHLPKTDVKDVKGFSSREDLEDTIRKYGDSQTPFIQSDEFPYFLGEMDVRKLELVDEKISRLTKQYDLRVIFNKNSKNGFPALLVEQDRNQVIAWLFSNGYVARDAETYEFVGPELSSRRSRSISSTGTLKEGLKRLFTTPFRPSQAIDWGRSRATGGYEENEE